MSSSRAATSPRGCSPSSRRSWTSSTARSGPFPKAAETASRPDVFLRDIIPAFRKDGRKTVGDADTREVTDLLRAWGRGDDDALEKLLSRVYADLRRMAKLQLANERAAHTLQPTALVHEVYLRLFHDKKVDWRDRAH